MVRKSSLMKFLCSRLNIEIPDDDEDEDAVIERRRKEREALLQVKKLLILSHVSKKHIFDI